MTWEAVGALGQVLGSIAVFVTLGYLAMQLRDARQQAQLSRRRNRNESVGEIWMQIAQSEWLNHVQTKVQKSLAATNLPGRARLVQSGLTEEEANAAILLETVWWMWFSQQIVTVDELSHGERVAFDGYLAAKYGPTAIDPLGRMFYELGKATTLNPEAVRYVERVLAQAGATATSR